MSQQELEKLSCRSRQRVLALVLGLGVLIALWRLGSTGLVDETPPLFAAAGRAMAETGDWLTPRVNGLPRYDKPPLIYWLMGLGFAIARPGAWDPWNLVRSLAIGALLHRLMLRPRRHRAALASGERCPSASVRGCCPPGVCAVASGVDLESDGCERWLALCSAQPQPSASVAAFC